MPVHATRPRSMRPQGKYRLVLPKPGEQRRIRILTNIMPDGPYGTIPSYSEHRVPNPQPGRSWPVSVPCIEERLPGQCRRIALPGGGCLHDYEVRDRPVVVVWDYEQNTPAILDLRWSMFTTIIRCSEMKEWGDPRNYDFIITCGVKAGTTNQPERLLQAVPAQPADPAWWAQIEQILPQYEAHMDPDVTAEEIAAFLQGQVLPEGAALPAPAGAPPTTAGGVVVPPAPVASPANPPAGPAAPVVAPPPTVPNAVPPAAPAAPGPVSPPTAPVAPPGAPEAPPTPSAAPSAAPAAPTAPAAPSVPGSELPGPTAAPAAPAAPAPAAPTAPAPAPAAPTTAVPAPDGIPPTWQ